MLILLTECHNGTFGQDCTEICGACIAKEPCHYVTGTCMNGCVRGFLNNHEKTRKLITLTMVHDYLCRELLNGFICKNISCCIVINVDKSRDIPNVLVLTC